MIARLDRAKTRRWLLILVPVAAATALYAAFIARIAYRVNGQTYFALFDDAMISMRYAHNLADGHGLIWNVGGAHVEGYTNFLWTLWMAAVHLLPVPDSKTSLFVMLTSVVLLVATAFVVRAITVRLCPQYRFAAPIALVSTLLLYPLIYWSLYGTEVGLVTLLLALQVLLAMRLRDAYCERDLVYLAAAVVLALLTRTDSVVFCVLTIAYVLLACPRQQRVKTGLVLGGALVGTLAAHTLFRALYYSDLLPNTYYLKMQGATLTERLSRGLSSLGDLTLANLYAPAVLALGYLLLLGRRVHSAAWLLVAIFIGQCAYSVYAGGDAWEWMAYSNRYITPAVIAVIILGALGLETCWRAEDGRRLRLVAALLAALFALVSLLNVVLAAGSVPPKIPVALPALFALLLLATAATGRFAGLPPISVMGSQLVRGVALLGVAVMFFVALNGQPFHNWLNLNAYDSGMNKQRTEFALALRETTKPDTSITVLLAGLVPYFYDRESVDLFGKSDRHVAKSKPHEPFYPGHNKYDTDYSIGKLRPDVIAQGAGSTAQMRRWGYVYFKGTLGHTYGVKTALWVRRDAVCRLFDPSGMLPRGACVQRTEAAPSS